MPGPAAHSESCLLIFKNYIYSRVLTWWLKDNLWELVFPYYHMSLGK